MIPTPNHPLLKLGCLRAELPDALGSMATPEWLAERLAGNGPAPVERSDDIKAAVRDLLRHGGFKPSGRNKPASEYLVKASENGRLGPINPAVDVCNVVSLYCGLPISVIDLDRTHPPLFVDVAAAGTEYVFNPSGQVLKTDGLLCLHDSDGPCANAVKDAQRTKTSETTKVILVLIWGVTAFPDQTDCALTWYEDILQRLNCQTETVLFGA